MRSSEQINDLAAALAKVQGTLKHALKDSENEAFKRGGKASRYADLTSVWDACREALAKNDIAVIQAHDIDESGDILVSRLVHKTGQWVESHYPLRPTTATPQGFASATTYARRISLASLVGVVADEDDDGNAASAKSGGAMDHPPPRVHSSPPPVDRAVNDARNKAIEWANNAHHALAKMKTMVELNAWLAKHNVTVEKLKDVVPDEFEALNDKINVTADRMNNLVAG